MPEIWDIYDSEGRKTGRFAVRGDRLNEGEYHLIVNVWRYNSRGEWLIDKRADRGFSEMDGLWESTGGAAVAGEESIDAALRESYEELGVKLKPEDGLLYAREDCERTNGGRFFRDVWVFKDETPISDIRFQESETCMAKWATPSEIKAMMAEGKFLGYGFYPYIDGMFERFTGEHNPV